jgi:hypothetical protein
MTQKQIRKGHTENGKRKGGTTWAPIDTRTPSGRELKY